MEEHIKSIDERFAALNISAAALCRAADINISTLWRWRNGRKMHVDTYDRVIKALDAMEAGRV